MIDEYIAILPDDEFIKVFHEMVREFELRLMSGRIGETEQNNGDNGSSDSCLPFPHEGKVQ